MSLDSKKIQGMTGLEVIKEHNIQAVAMRVDGELLDLSETINGEVEFAGLDDPDGLHVMRHSCAHMAAQATQRIFKTQKAIGPVTQKGFYYDFDSTHTFSTEDLAKIEKEMKNIVKEKLTITKEVLSKADAIALFDKMDEQYKVEIIKGIEDDTVTLYKQGEFIDLCKGPHVPHTGWIKAFKLRDVSGAYWKNDKDNKMLQRVTGYAFGSKDALTEYLEFLKEVEKRDHRRIAKEMKLLTFSPFAPGSTLWLPRGMELRKIVEQVSREEHMADGYQEIKTPTIMNRSLWETSGHWENYRDNMYETETEDEIFAVKPMNCPGHVIAYKNQMHSYKDLPIRFYELGNVFRRELSGTMHGLMRRREFTQDDAHIFVTPEQIEDELVGVIGMVGRIFDRFGFTYSVNLSTQPDKYIGSDEMWAKATSALENALKKQNIEYQVNEGDGAFYGPKIDYQVKDAIGRTWQCSTIQLDFNLPERFDMEYVGNDGEKHRPIMIHRAIFGSVERFMGILIEHHEGKFPLWLSPTQARILTISEKSDKYAKEVFSKLKEQGIRVELDLTSDRISQKIKKSSLEKVPLQLVIGEKEVENKNLNVRFFGDNEEKTMDVKEIVELIKKSK